MVVSLYTSRIVLDQLGATDYGIYSLVGGIVAMFGFLNAAMSSATLRFLSFDIGQDLDSRLKKTFSTVLTIHFLIAFIVLVLSETVGLWYVNNKLIFPENRTLAVNIVYQVSIVAALLKIIQVPYNSLIIAREKMQVYAYIGIIEVIIKLVAVFLLIYYGSDKLIAYSVLVLIIAIIISIIYVKYCNIKFNESSYKFVYDRLYFRELLSFSGWSLFGNFAAIGRSQGLNLVLNLFYSTMINAAYGITLVVQGAINAFVTNFQVAVSPQIIKFYAQNNLKEMEKLIYRSSKFSFYMILILSIPMILNIDFLLNLWLKDPPPKISTFVTLSMVYLLIDSISYSLIISVQASGKIKWYQIIVGSFIFLTLPVSYVVLFYGGSPESVYFVLISITFGTLILRMFFVKSLCNIKPAGFFKNVLIPIILVVAALYLVYFVINKFTNVDLVAIDIMDFLYNVAIEAIVTLLLIIFLGLNRNEKQFILNRIKLWIN
jgi:O-antigen/teichoic acid export membrane protein